MPMGYKTILMHWDAAEAPETCGEAAAALARRFDAHLTVMAYGIEPGLSAYGFGGPAAGALAYEVESAREQARARREEAEQWLDRTGAKGEVRAMTCSIDTLPRSVGEATRVADLLVLGAPYEEAREEIAVRVLEGALFDGAAPVLVTPPDPASIGTRPMIAWDGSLEAAMAVKGALGFLESAESAEVVLIDPDTTAEDEPEPGADLALMLSRHGISVDLAHVPSGGHTIAEVLSRRLTETGADLLVMGAYGHSRLRESLIGGPTRDILRALPGPVLLAH
jgi:nucleotide-binding universal stress UspA family protein